jgi:hypothetical protein
VGPWTCSLHCHLSSLLQSLTWLTAGLFSLVKLFLRYYSWDAGLVHYIAISTEVWFGVGGIDVNRKSLLAWLEADLKAANANRDKVPWIIAHGHRDIYCSTSDDSDCNAPGDACVFSSCEAGVLVCACACWSCGHDRHQFLALHSFAPSLVCSRFHSPDSLTHFLTNQFTHLLTHSLTHPTTHPHTHTHTPSQGNRPR